MPSSGLPQPRQGDHAQPLDAHPAVELEVGAHDLARDAPPAVRDRTWPSASRPSRVASAAGIATPLAPVSTRNSTGRPLSVPGQW